MSRKFSPEMNQPLESRELPTAQLAHAEVFKIRNTVSPKSIINPAQNATQKSLLGQYLFNGNPFDSTGKNGSFNLTNTSFKNKALYLNGVYEYNGKGQGYRAWTEARNLSYNRFTVALTFNAEKFSMDQIATPLVVGGEWYRWFVLKRSQDGKLAVTLNNHINSYTSDLNTKIHAGMWNTVVCGIDVSKRRLTAYMNGKLMIDVNLPLDFSFTVTDSDQKLIDKKWTFTNYSNGTAFNGLIDTFSYYDRKLTNYEMQKLSAQGRK